MQTRGIAFTVFLVLCIYLSISYIPQSQLTSYHASAELSYILIDPGHTFSLASVNTGPSANPHPSPFLFIHGYKGSVEHAISMANHFQNNEIDIKMYSVDFSKGAVGLSYDLLKAQADFTTTCINEISKRHQGQALTIIGHSFGGIVAGLSLGNITAGTVKGLIALGTPFEASPISSDFKMLRAYDEVHKYISESDIFVISITGGIRDLVVPSQLTNIKELRCENSIHIYSTSIRGFHKEIDHAAIAWGLEFIEILGSIVKICEKSEGSQIITEVKHLVTSEFSLMVENVSNESDAIIVVLPKTQEIKKFQGLVLGESNYYILPLTSSGIIPISSKTQKIHMQSSDYSVISLFFGVKIPVKLGQNLATYISPGPEFSEPRLTLRVSISGDGKARAMLAKCGHEEIIKYNENDFILYFHEHCENGPEIWILGNDDDKEYTVELKIDFFGTLVSLTRDLRKHILASMFYICLVYLISEHANIGLYDSRLLKLHGFVLTSLYFFGRTLRNLPIPGIENPNQNINYGVIDLVYIIAAGIGLSFIANLLFEMLELISKRLEEIGKAHFAIIPLFYWYPWPVFTLFLLIVPGTKIVRQIVFLCFFSMLPQHVGWYVALFTHGIYGVDFAILCPCIFLTAKVKNELKFTGELVIAMICIVLFCQDNLVRITYVFFALCFWGNTKNNFVGNG